MAPPTRPQEPAAQPAAHVAPNTPVNVLGASITFAGALLWPAFQIADDATPADQRGTTREIQNHWHVTPGRLNAFPAAPAWAAAEVLTAAAYPYDKRSPGLPLPGVDVDLFGANAGIDFDDYEKIRTLYE